MATTYTPLGALADSVEVVGTEVRLKATIPVNTTVSGTIRRNTDGVVTDISATFKSVSKVREIRKLRGNRTAVVPQAFYDASAIDLGSANTHPHLGAADVTAVKDGLWSDPTLWSTGIVPTEGQKVDTASFDTTYDLERDIKLASLHSSAAGTFRITGSRDTRLIVDTLMLHGKVIIGELGNPIPESPTLGKPRCEVAFWQAVAPLKTVRLGINTMGQVRIQGADKVHELRSDASILAGAASVTLSDVATSSWRVGDTILFPGTEKSGSGVTSTDASYFGPTQVYAPFRNDPGVQTRSRGYRISTDEERVITAIAGNVISWSGGLSFDHKLYTATLPHGQVVTLKPRVANKSRSIEFRTLGGKARDTEIWPGADLTVRQKRSHAMFMGCDDVQIRNARFLDMGRTDNDPSLAIPTGAKFSDATKFADVLIVDPVAYDKPPGDVTRVVITDLNNVRGRYPLHIHGTGAFNGRRMVVVEGCVTDASPGSPVIPGWAIVQHNSRATLERCIVHRVRGAGMVSELGNETGQWLWNLVCGAVGDGFDIAFGTRGEWWPNHNGHYGVGYENQARQILLQNNHATSVHKAYAWMQQDVTEGQREADSGSIRLFDPLSKGFVGVVTSPENWQIPDFIDNTFANCSEGFYVEHRLNNLDRNEETPMVIRGFHGLNTDVMFNINNYAQHYYVYDSLWDGFTNGSTVGSVAGAFMFVNMAIRNGVNGFNNGQNYTGHVIDIAATNVTAPLVPHVVAADTTNITTNPQYNSMEQWVVSSPGFVRVRSGTPLNSATDLPVPFPSPPYGRQLPGGNPAVAVGGTPYFVLDTGTSVLTVTPTSRPTVAGAIRDSVGDRRFGDYQNPETWPSNYSIKVGRTGNGMLDGTGIVLRNGCFNDAGTWKSRLWFTYVDRATGVYFHPTVDLILSGFDAGFLAANTLDPLLVKPTLPLLPEAPTTRPLGIAPAASITSSTALTLPEGEVFTHVLRSTDVSPSYILSGPDAALFALVKVDGLFNIRFVGDAVKDFEAPTDANADNVYSFSVAVRGVGGVTSTSLAHTLTITNVNESFLNNFSTGFDTDGQLDANGDWVQIGGVTGAAYTAFSGVALNSGTGASPAATYRAPSRISDNYVLSTRFDNGAGESLSLLCLTNVNTWIGVREQEGRIVAYKSVGGVRTAIYTASNNRGQSGTRVVSIEKVGDTFTHKEDGVTIGTFSRPGDVPVGDKQGVFLNGTRFDQLYILSFSVAPL